MPHQPTIVGFPRRCSSDLTGDDIQRRKGEKVSHCYLNANTFRLNLLMLFTFPAVLIEM